MRLIGRAVAACALAGWLSALGGCGGGSSSAGAGQAGAGYGGTVDVYSSLPMHGAARGHALAIRQGITLALSQAHYRAGRFRVRYVALDDSTASAGGWDATQTAGDARRAAQDPKAVYYVGDLDSDASKISIPILNRSGVPQVSPTNTYVGLTTHDPGSAPGEPIVYYPTGRRTFLRIVPRETIEAEAGLKTMKEDGCTSVALAADRSEYGSTLRALMQSLKRSYGIDVVDVATPSIPVKTFTARLRGQGINCVYLAAMASARAIRLARFFTAAAPQLRMYGGDGICTSGFARAVARYTNASGTRPLQCTRVTRALSAYPGGREFAAKYRAMYGHAPPDAVAMYGYEAMKLGLATIATLGPDGNDKLAVLQALFGVTDRRSVLGTYGFDADGDTTLTSYGLYEADGDGLLLFERTIAASGPSRAP